jgi:hypothetical protein
MALIFDYLAQPKFFAGVLQSHTMEHPESLTLTFTPVQYDPNDPTSLRRQGVPVQLGTS